MRRFFARVIILMLMAINSVFYTNCSGGFNTLAADANQVNLGSSGGQPTLPQQDPPLDPPEVIPNDGKIDVFVASGHMGRTIMSCDDGKTWVKDQSDDDSARCWITGDPNYVECDHNPSAGHGIDYNDGYFFTNFGWGFNGSVRRSEDGANWTVIKTGGWGGGSGVAYTNNRLFVMWSPNNWKWSYSDNIGSSWQDIPNLQDGSAFEARFDKPSVKRVKNDLYVYSRIDGLGISHDQGLTWQYNPNFSKDVTSGLFTGGNGILISLGVKTITLADSSTANQGLVSRSVDGGLTWNTQVIFQETWGTFSSLIFTGTEFQAYSPGKVWKSSNGVNWTSTPLVVNGFNAGVMAGPVSYNPHTGIYVMILNIWDGNYDKQRAFRSTDGIHWDTLDTSHFKGGHPIFNIIRGRALPGSCL